MYKDEDFFRFTRLVETELVEPDPTENLTVAQLKEFQEKKSKDAGALGDSREMRSLGSSTGNVSLFGRDDGGEQALIVLSRPLSIHREIENKDKEGNRRQMF